MGTPPRAPTHADLLAELRSLEVAAMRGDAPSVRLLAKNFRGSLALHISGESEAVACLGVASRRVVLAGQRRLLRHVDRILRDGGLNAAPTLPEVARISSALARQARLEAGVFAGSTRFRLRSGGAPPKVNDN